MYKKADLEQKIYDLVDRIHRSSRDDMRHAILDLVTDVLDDRTHPTQFTLKDLNELRQAALKEGQDLPCPAYMDKETMSNEQRVAFCYLMAMISFLRKRSLIKYLVEVNTDGPFIYSIFEE